MQIQYTSQKAVEELDRDNVVVVNALLEGEDRGTWWSALTKARNVTLFPQGNPVLEFNYGGNSHQVRNGAEIAELLRSWVQMGEVYIDITTLPYEIWAVFVRKAVYERIPIKAIYVEPRDYSKVTRQSALREFELSDEIYGLENLPGFGKDVQDDEPFGLVVLLGFEGARFGFLIEKVEGERAGKLVPIIGVPGFRPEFVRYAFEGNLHTLEKTESYRSVRYARANCPFSMFAQIRELSDEMQDPLLKIGLIGTRPHGLGAVLYALLSKRKTSLLFDFPVKRKGRSIGMGKVLIYDIMRFCEEVGYVS